MKTVKIEKLVANLQYEINLKNLKQALNHGIVLKKVYRIMKFNQKERRKKTKHDFEKDFF